MNKQELEQNFLHSGTTLVGVVCKDGVVMGADRQSTAGNLVVGKNVQKAIQINDYLVISATGMVADIELQKKVIRAELKLKELKSKRRPTVREAANMIGMMTYRNIRQPSMVPSIVGTLVAGFNEDGTAELYTIEPAGTAMKVEDYDANFGSGMPYVLGFLEREWKKDSTCEEGVKMAVESLKSSTQRDTGSGFGIDVFSIKDGKISHEIAQEIAAEYKDKEGMKR
jgi:proteasome beta subunit